MRQTDRSVARILDGFESSAVRSSGGNKPVSAWRFRIGNMIGHAMPVAGGVLASAGFLLCLTIIGAVAGVALIMLGGVLIVIGFFIQFRALVVHMLAVSAHSPGCRSLDATHALRDRPDEGLPDARAVPVPLLSESSMADRTP